MIRRDRNSILVRFAAVLGVGLCLAGCEGEDAERGQQTAATPAPIVAPTRSIIRPAARTVPEPVPEQSLEPLTLVIAMPDGATLSEAERAQLETVLNSEQIARGGSIVLRGHTDSSGSDEVNLRAARRRAEAVRDWLVERGIAPERIETIALGEQNPVAPNALPDGTPNEAGRAANRRVELTVEAVPPGGRTVEGETEGAGTPTELPSPAAS